jgi:serine/threonine-protein kinase ATR
MDFNHVVNQLMLAEPDGRRRNLRLRTFAVVCLNEECGILEWVNNTACMRHLVLESYQYFSSKEFTNPHNRVLYDKFQRIQQHLEYDFDSLLADYNEHFANTIKPCFHRWFLEAFSDPTRWLESRKAFTHSAAVWSAVGHVVGLGDRHTENILLDTSSGECVHVDFDCLFDKGLGLARPEIVPFRLTPNIVDAMGVMGTEGPYRRCMEVCVKLLRENKDALLGVLEPFLRDPTVAWGRTGRAQRNDSEANARAGAYQDQENADAKAALEKISGRLTGIYNLIHPHADKIILGHEKKGRAPPTKGMCAAQGELSLSVSGQVQRLIEEATNVENLCQMYVGWCPWL